MQRLRCRLILWALQAVSACPAQLLPPASAPDTPAACETQMDEAISAVRYMRALCLACTAKHGLTCCSILLFFCRVRFCVLVSGGRPHGCTATTELDLP